MIAMPDPSTFRVLPWRPEEQGVGRMFCDILTPERTPYEGDPRHVLRRALDNAPECIDRNWFDGLRMVVRQFEDTLQAQGVSPIPAVGEKFDPSQHEAIAREETDEQEEGTIVEEMQPGYRLHERVLRPTLVKVAHPRALKS